MPAQHRRRAAHHRDKCANDHDLTIEGALTPEGYCRECRLEQMRRKRRRYAGETGLFGECTRCGRDKWRDNRRLCFACRDDQVRSGHSQAPSVVDRKLVDAVLLESAPAYIRSDPTTWDAWLAVARTMRG